MCETDTNITSRLIFQIHLQMNEIPEITVTTTQRILFMRFDCGERERERERERDEYSIFCILQKHRIKGNTSILYKINGRNFSSRFYEFNSL